VTAVLTPRSKAEVIVCQTSESDKFAKRRHGLRAFQARDPLSAMLEIAPPDGSYCTIGSAVVTVEDLLDTLGAMCTNRGDTLDEGAAG
jgi:hypothetical protein